MAKYKYTVVVNELNEIHELPGAWGAQDYLALLKHIEYDDADNIPPAELKEMACLALSDFDQDEAAIKLLELRFGDKLNKGQRQNLAVELKEDRIWEEYSNIAYHEELFNVCCMLYWAYPKKYAMPDIVEIKLTVTAANAESAANLSAAKASFLTRLLNDGMDEHNIIYRLFDDNIRSNSFPEAEHIIWQFEAAGFNQDSNSNSFTIYTSWNWVDELKGVQSYDSTAFADGQFK